MADTISCRIYHTTVQTKCVIQLNRGHFIPTFETVMRKKIQDQIARLPKWLTNIYFICGVSFLVWMIVIDDNNVVNQYRKHAELSALLEKKKFYLQQISETQKQLTELTSSPTNQEKFAREHYWMKRDNEDVYVIVKK